MCFFSTPKVETPAAPVQKRPKSAISEMFNKRRTDAKGTFGNIFTSPLGTSENAQTRATKLGGTSTISI